MSEITNAEKLYDAVIIGGGPAGLTAAIYLARARYRVIVVEKDHFGGQITITSEVVNYPGVFSASGTELTETMRKQAESFGAEFLLAEVTSIDLEGTVKHISTTKGSLECYAVLLATGASPRTLGFKGEEEFKGHGVAYCATCDGEFFAGKDVFVIGGGFAAAEEAVFLTKYARHVTIMVRRDDFSCAPAAAEEAKNHEKISVLYNTEVEEVSGDTAPTRMVYKNNKTGEKTVFEAAPGESFGVFVFVGYAPATQLVADFAETNPQGYIVTDEHQATTADGLFAAGDVCIKPLRQVATAVGQAATTATEMERYIKVAHDKTGVVPMQPTSRPQASNSADSGSAESASGTSALFDDAMMAQLNVVFGRMASSLILRLHLDDKPVSAELKGYMEELASLTDHLRVEDVPGDGDDPAELPYVEVCRADGAPSGLEFHGVPGGHEFTSFVLGLYNTAGPGQPISDEDRAGIAAISTDTDIRVLVGLSCTMCPEVVLSAQRIAADNVHVSARVYDINHFAALKDRYNVMSVPCIVVARADGTEKVSFGKKNLSQVLELIS